MIKQVAGVRVGVKERKFATAKRVGQRGGAEGKACKHARWFQLYEAPGVSIIWPPEIDRKRCPVSRG